MTPITTDEQIEELAKILIKQRFFAAGTNAGETGSRLDSKFESTFNTFSGKRQMANVYGNKFYTEDELILANEFMKCVGYVKCMLANGFTIAKPQG